MLNKYVPRWVIHVQNDKYSVHQLKSGGSFMCLKKVAALSERRSSRGRILFVTVYSIKRKGTDPHQKGQEKG